MTMYGAVINTLILLVLIGTLWVGWMAKEESRKERLANERIRGIERFEGLWGSDRENEKIKERWSAIVSRHGATIVDTEAGENKDMVRADVVVVGAVVEDNVLVLNDRNGEKWKIELKDTGLALGVITRKAELYQKFGKKWVRMDTMVRRGAIEGNLTMMWSKYLPDPNGPRWVP